MNTSYSEVPRLLITIPFLNTFVEIFRIPSYG